MRSARISWLMVLIAALLISAATYAIVWTPVFGPPSPVGSSYRVQRLVLQGPHYRIWQVHLAPSVRATLGWLGLANSVALYRYQLEGSGRYCACLWVERWNSREKTRPTLEGEMALAMKGPTGEFFLAFPTPRYPFFVSRTVGGGGVNAGPVRFSGNPTLCCSSFLFTPGQNLPNVIGPAIQIAGLYESRFGPKPDLTAWPTNNPNKFPVSPMIYSPRYKIDEWVVVTYIRITPGGTSDIGWPELRGQKIVFVRLPKIGVAQAGK